MIGTVQGPWLPCAAALLVVIAIRRSGGRGEACLASTEVWFIAALTACAAALRLACGIWGPLHVNGQGPLWIRGALDPTPLAGYGPGYFELFRLVQIFGPFADRALFTANALLSGVAPALLYVAARLLGVGRSGALAVAGVLALDAVSIRTAASESYFASLIALVLAVQVALAHGARGHVRGDRFALNLSFVAAGLVAAAAARIHPMSYLPLALSPLVVLGAAQPESVRSRGVLAVRAGATMGVIVLLTSATTIIAALRASPMTGQAIGGFTQRDGILLILLAVLALLVHRWTRPAWLPLLGIGSLGLLLATRNAFLQSPLWQLCYQRVYLAGMLLGLAPLLPRRVPGVGWAAAVAGATVLIVPALPFLRTPTTEQLEYRFLQEALRRAPRGCTIAAVSRAGLRQWEIPSFLAPEDSGQRNVTVESDLDAAPGDCLLYVRSSLCSSVEARPLCESVERRGSLERVASSVFPAVPSYTGLPYDRSEVEVVLFRVTEHKLGVNDGIAITPAFAQALYDRLKMIDEITGCTIARFDTSRFRISLALRAPSGAEHTVEMAAPQANKKWMLVASDDGRRECAAMIAAIERALEDVGKPTSQEMRFPPVERGEMRSSHGCAHRPIEATVKRCSVR